jgi:hypothetical protein
MAIFKKTDDVDPIETPVENDTVQDAAFLQNKEKVGVSLGEVMSMLKKDERVLTTDPAALVNVSTAPLAETPVGMSEEQLQEVRQRSTIMSCLDNPKAAGVLSPDMKRQYADIAESMKTLPTPDTVAYIDNRKLHMPAEVRDVPNRVDKESALLLIEKLVGKHITARIVLCSMAAGFVDKPHVWFSQRLWAEGVRDDIWEKVVKIPNYVDEFDEDKAAIVPLAITRLFSNANTRNLTTLCKMNQISMLHACKIMFTRICDAADAEKKPKEYVKTYDSMPELQALLAAG